MLTIVDTSIASLKRLWSAMEISCRVFKTQLYFLKASCSNLRAKKQ